MKWESLCSYERKEKGWISILKKKQKIKKSSLIKFGCENKQGFIIKTTDYLT